MVTIFGDLTSYSDIEPWDVVPLIVLTFTNLVSLILVVNFSGGSICGVKEKFKHVSSDLLGDISNSSCLLGLFSVIVWIFMLWPFCNLVLFIMAIAVNW